MTNVRHIMSLTREKPVKRCPCCGSPVTGHMFYKVIPEEFIPCGWDGDCMFELRFKAKCGKCYLTMDVCKQGECTMPESLEQMERYLSEDMQELEDMWNRRARSS